MKMEPQNVVSRQKCIDLYRLNFGEVDVAPAPQKKEIFISGRRKYMIFIKSTVTFSYDA